MRRRPSRPEAAQPPTPGAEPLLDRLRPSPERSALARRLLAGVWVVASLSEVSPAFRGVAVTRSGRVLDAALGELRQAPAGGEERVLAERNRRAELVAASEAAVAAEAVARAEADRARELVAAADASRDEADGALRVAARAADEAAEGARRLSERARRRGEAPDEGPEAVRRAAVEAELRAERRAAEREERERAERAQRRARLVARIAADDSLAVAAERAATALAAAQSSVGARRAALAGALDAGAAMGERAAQDLRSCAREEADLQTKLRTLAEAVTGAEVRAERARDRARERGEELAEIAGRLGLDAASSPPGEPLSPERRAELEATLDRLARRREQLGPVNPLAGEAYAEALAHVEELEGQREDLETALTELEALIRDIDRRIRESFESTFEAAAKNFEELAAHLFPGGRGRLRLVRADGSESGVEDPDAPVGAEGQADDATAEAGPPRDDEPGVEVEVTPAGKATRRLSLLSGGEKSLVALAFLFAVFLARPCPFYILDEVEAALDDLNIDRFLELLRRYSDRAQFIVVTHQKRTMDAADRVYGVSMGADGVSKVVSRRLRGAAGAASASEGAEAEAA